MITQWRLNNFKSVYEKTSLMLKPLTILVGANSSGKSTLIQSILLLSQSIGNQVAARPIILNGRIMRLGSFDDLVSSGSNNKEISIGLTYEFPEDEISKRAYSFRAPRPRRSAVYGLPEEWRTVNCDVSFSASKENLPSHPTDQPSQELLQLQPYVTKVKYEVQKAGDAQNVVLDVVRASKSPDERLKQMSISAENVSPELVESLNYEVVSSKIYEPFQEGVYPGVPQSGKMAGVRLFHFLPTMFSFSYDKTSESAARIVQYFTSGRLSASPLSKEDSDSVSRELLERVLRLAEDFIGLPENERLRIRASRFIETAKADLSAENVQRVVRQIHSAGLLSLYEQHHNELLRIARARREKEPSIKFVHVPTVGVSHFLDQVLTEQLRYLGPLRDEPKPFYPLEGAVNPGDVGFKGEFTAAVLDLHRRTRVLYMPTSSFIDKEPTSELPDLKEVPLEDAIVEWLKYLGVVNEVKTADKGVFGHELRVAAGEGEALHNLVHVGVGVSQVLPILVMSLLSDPGSTLIFEQPELHLHPKVQTLLADFLLSMILSGRQCIVETHSEYIVNRIRLRAARDVGDNLQNMFAMYFVEKEAGHSAFRHVHVNEYGAIDDWPRGFFDQSPQESERILRAAMEKRRRRR